jgi:hypothetical protein
MTKTKNSITINIKGRDWQFVLVPDKTFDKMHNGDGGSRTAMTMVNQYRTDFRKSDWCLVDIIHELGHVVYSLSPTRSANLTPYDVEEVMCDIYSTDYFEIGKWAGMICEKFFGRE